jgi:hypothetical protein
MPKEVLSSPALKAIIHARDLSERSVFSTLFELYPMQRESDDSKINNPTSAKERLHSLAFYRWRLKWLEIDALDVC